MEFTEEEREAFEEAWQDLDEKLVFVQILWELRAIRNELQQPVDSSESPRFQCQSCHEYVLEEDLEKHLVDQHNAPADVNPYNRFEKV